ncbi:MAG: LysR family transcriptional regulator [Pseudomonadota bacterium]
MPIFARVASYFEEVARRGSIRRAAEHLHVTASAVDRQIILLEERVGMPLFERLPRGVRLTAAGELMLKSIQQLARDFDATVASVDALRTMRSGHVRLIGLQFLADRIFPDLVCAIRQAHPGMSVSAQIGSTEQVMGAVLDGQADFGICYAPPGQLPVTIVASQLLQMGVALAPAHALAGRRSLTFAECLAHPMVLPPAGMELRTRIECMHPHSAIALRPMVETNSIGLMKAILRDGVHLGFLTSADVQAEVEQGSLLLVPLSDMAGMPSVLTLIAPVRQQASVSASAVAGQVAAAFAALAP